MICLDTNYLINALSPSAPEAAAIIRWYKKEKTLAASSTVWYEMISRPVESQHISLIRPLVSILPFGEAEAREASRLFTLLGRRREMRINAIIAATTIISSATLATNNKDDFLPFVPYGLVLENP